MPACPICGKEFSNIKINEHVNECLDMVSGNEKKLAELDRENSFIQRVEGDHGLPQGWEMFRDGKGRIYFVDHINQRSTWEDPRKRNRANLTKPPPVMIPQQPPQMVQPVILHPLPMANSNQQSPQSPIMVPPPMINPNQPPPMVQPVILPHPPRMINSNQQSPQRPGMPGNLNSLTQNPSNKNLRYSNYPGIYSSIPQFVPAPVGNAQQQQFYQTYLPVQTSPKNQRMQDLNSSSKPTTKLPSEKLKKRFRHQTCIKEGFLFSSLLSPSNFLERWVVLQEGSSRLVMYTEEQIKVEEIELIHITVIGPEGDAFQLKSRKGRYFYFRASSPREAAEWTEVIRKQIIDINEKIQIQEEEKKVHSIQNSSATKSKIQGWAILQKQNKEKKIVSEDYLKQIDENWLVQLKSNLENEQPLITGQMTLILSVEKHRFGKFIPTFVDSFKKKYKKFFKKDTPITEQTFTPIIQEIKTFIDGLISAIDQYYNNLCDLSPHVSYHIQCSIENILFPLIYPEVFALFKKMYKEEDSAFEKKIRDLLTINPAHLGINEVFWLVPENIDVDPPYYKAISLIQNISSATTPWQKLAILVEGGKVMVECIHQFWEGKKNPEELTIGGDEFLPLFAYIILKSRIPTLISEFHFMSFFIDELSSTDRTGYMLATLQSCVTFLSGLEKADMENSGKEMLKKIFREAEVFKVETFKDAPTISFEDLENLLNEENQLLSNEDNLDNLIITNPSPSPVDNNNKSPNDDLIQW